MFVIEISIKYCRLTCITISFAQGIKAFTHFKWQLRSKLAVTRHPVSGVLGSSVALPLTYNWNNVKTEKFWLK